jgi:hypothetical protein
MVIPVGQKVWGIDIGCGDTLLVAGTDEKAHFFDVRKGNKVCQPFACIFILLRCIVLVCL